MLLQNSACEEALEASLYKPLLEVNRPLSLRSGLQSQQVNNIVADSREIGSFTKRILF
jgi:hypothetical protein